MKCNNVAYMSPGGDINVAYMSPGGDIKTWRRKKGFGSLLPRGGRWAIRWTVDGRTVQEQTRFKVGNAADRRKAEKLLEEKTEIFRLKHERDQLAILIAKKEDIEARLRKLQAASDPLRQSIILGELVETWRTSPRRRECSAEQFARNARQVEAFVKWAGVGVDFRAVTDQVAEKYAAKLAGEVGANTYNKHINTLSAVWKSIGRSHGVNINPWADLPRRKLDTHSRRTLSDDEIEKILDVAKGEVKALILIGLRTGLRMGDAVNLKWEDISPGGVVKISTRKTGAAVVVPARGLEAELTRAGFKRGKGEIMKGLAEDFARDGSSVTMKIERTFKRAGLSTSVREKGWKRARPEATFHSLRHTFVTRAIERGVPAPIVRAIVGHASAAMTDHYTHVGEAAIVAAFEGRDG